MEPTGIAPEAQGPQATDNCASYCYCSSLCGRAVRVGPEVRLRSLSERLPGYVHRAKNHAEKPLRRLSAGWARWQLTRRGLLAVLANRPANAYPPNVVDLWFLYRQVRARKPTCVLEFGAGCSTVVLAQALADNANGGRLYSIDAVPHWAETTWATMPAHLQTLTTVTSSEIAGVTIGDYHVLRHRPIPDVVPDFVYVDGPDFQEFTHLADFPAACDVLDLEPPVVSQRAEGPPTRRVMVCRGNRGIGTSRLDDEIRGDSGAEAKEG